MHPRARDLRGQRVGYLKVLKYQGSDGRRSLWDVQCVCGSRVVFSANELQKLQARGVQASCGCRRWQTVALRVTRHGMSRHPAYAVYRSMLDRCTRPSHPAWKNYGGRGIKVCNAWRNSFEAFWLDMGSSYAEGLLLERVNNQRGYSATNCRWATREEQARNRRGAILVKGKPLAQLAAETGVRYGTLYARYKAGARGARLVAPLKPKSSTC